MKILGQPGLEISIPSTLKHETTSYVVTTRGTEHFVDETHDHKNELRPGTELLNSQPFRNQKGENLVWKKRNPTASRKLVLILLQVDMATRKLVQTISAILPVILC